MPVPQTTNLTKATDGLYSVFVRYPPVRHPADCPHCAANPGWPETFARPIRQFGAYDLDALALNVVIPGGDVEELKHFLPRLFELFLIGDLDVDPEALLFTLTRSGWVARGFPNHWTWRTLGRGSLQVATLNVSPYSSGSFIARSKMLSKSPTSSNSQSESLSITPKRLALTGSLVPSQQIACGPQDGLR